jgi:adenine-specific DNA-methyltransferase
VRTSSEVTADKLRGGFYSPGPLVKICLDRVSSLLSGDGRLRVLEPSAGDGAFLDGLASHALAPRVTDVTAIEIVGPEAAACRTRLNATGLGGEVVHGSALSWALGNKQLYDVAVGNPPFVRFQFVDDAERLRAARLGERLGTKFKGVSNLWLPVLLAALGALRPGGVFAFIVPAECFTGISGYEVRAWLLEHVHALHVDLFTPGSFPGVLQEVIVLSGRMVEDGRTPTRSLHLREHAAGGTREWQHSNVARVRTWTRFLLDPRQVASLNGALQLASVTPLGWVARFEVATVTGANGFFCVNDATVREYDLADWTRPLLPRTRHALGLAYTADDHAMILRDGFSGHLLSFSPDRPDPERQERSKAYLAQGIAGQLHTRYKCRIRAPWYRVPVVPPGAMMMTKRSHFFPRVIVNDANVVTTDTIYRGRIVPGAGMTPRDFAASFHNSLTLLTAEIEGRSFGGGVLELVPSEISRLALPHPENMADEFDRLDWICRSSSDEDNAGLVEETDRLVVKKTPGLSKALMSELQEALRVLRGLRLART